MEYLRALGFGASLTLAAAASLVAACGQTGSSRSGLQWDDGAGSGGGGGSGDAAGAGSSAGNGAAGGGGLAAAGAASGSGGAGSGAGGAVGPGGAPASGGGLGFGGSDNPFPLTGTGAPVICEVPALPTPTTPEGEARALLIDEYCAKLEQYPCLGLWPGEASQYASTCDLQARVAACELDVILEYQRSITAACDDEWQASLACATGVDYAAVCNGDVPEAIYGLIPITQLQSPGYEGEPCRPERQALSDCMNQENPWSELTGARASCDYHLAANNPGICEVICQVDSNYFEADCSGSATGGPFECTCWLNANPLLDDGFGYNPRFFGGSCEDAAQRMADGECVERVDCCFTWQSGTESGCACTADPQTVGHETCADAAAAGGGEVVELCPQYEMFFGGLNIERSSN